MTADEAKKCHDRIWAKAIKDKLDFDRINIRRFGTLDGDMFILDFVWWDNDVHKDVRLETTSEVDQFLKELE